MNEGLKSLIRAGQQLEQKVEFDSYNNTMNFKVLLVQERRDVYPEIMKHLNIPFKEFGIISFKMNKESKETMVVGETRNLIYNFFQHINPELIICIGKKATQVFIPDITVTKEYGKLFEKDKVFNKYVVCCLCKPSFFKHRRIHPNKQLMNIKSYLMRNFGYGLVKND